jgi:uncharacterized damage-inducible protein DinB
MEQPADESTIVALFRYHTWANLTVIDACAALPAELLDLTAPGTFGAINHTLTHVIANEEHYLTILTREPVERPVKRGEVLGLAELRRRAQASGEALIRAAAQVRLGQTCSVSFEGQESPVPLYIMLIQAINHGVEHRTNITTIMTQYGIQAPAIDGWGYMAATDSHEHCASNPWPTHTRCP